MTLYVALLALPLYLCYTLYSGLQRNIAKARNAELAYVVLPLHWYSLTYALTHKFWLPLLPWLPARWTEDMRLFYTSDWQWKYRYDPFAKYGDTFAIVTPTSFHIITADADAINQISHRREAFPKPVETYVMIDIFGRNVVTTEGSEWKFHRKITAPGFNEKNNALIFKESIAQAQGMVRKWLGPDGSGRATLSEIPKDTMRVALHIISYVGFGVRLLWPSESDKGKGMPSDVVPPGFKMSYENALSTLLDNIFMFILAPKWLLKWLPFERTQRLRVAYQNWEMYMQRLFEEKMNNDQRGEGMDIMGSLVRSSYENGRPKMSPKSTTRMGLTYREILGNAFVMLLAGHETTANTIHFTIIYLAMRASSQHTLQKEIEAFFGDEPPENWSYESSLHFFLNGMVGAVINEQLRVMPPVVSIPKKVSVSQDQTVMLNGTPHVFPKETPIMFSVATVHCSPKYWPSTGPSTITDLPHDLNDFVPERWLQKDGQRSKGEESDTSSLEDFGGFTGSDVSASLFRPAPGAFIPFSIGPRSCLGRRIAQIEVASVLATVFQHYSVELAVDEWATDDEVAAMSDVDKKALYEQAMAAARATLATATSIITLKLPKGGIPLRLVRKGEERFLPLFR